MGAIHFPKGAFCFVSPLRPSTVGGSRGSSEMNPYAAPPSQAMQEQAAEASAFARQHAMFFEEADANDDDELDFQEV